MIVPLRRRKDTNDGIIELYRGVPSQTATLETDVDPRNPNASGLGEAEATLIRPHYGAAASPNPNES